MLTRKVRRLPERRVVRGEGLKQAVLDAARRICFAEGVDGVSARKIARAVGCSATAIYLYYKNIDDLLHHLRMEGHTRLADYFARVDSSLPAPQRLLEMGRAYFGFGLEHPKYYELMFLSRFENAPRSEFIQREIFTLLMVRDVAQEGIERGEIRADIDPMILAHGLWSNMHGLTSLAVSGLLVRTAPERTDALLGAILEEIARWIRPERISS